MVILRPTRKLQSLLPVSKTDEAPSDTALGDWYVNRLSVDRQPLLLLVSSLSLLPILVPARDVRGLPGRLPGLVEERLRRLGIDERAIAAEVSAMSPVLLAPTASRSVLGIMVDFAGTVPYFRERGEWEEGGLARIEESLADTPCFASGPFSRVVFPRKKAPELLNEKWLADISP